MLLKKEKFADLTQALAVYGQVITAESSLDFPRAALLPRVERLYSYKAGSEGLEISESAPPEPAILLGLRPCEARAVDNLDQIFLRGPYADKTYALRRQNVLLLATACAEAGSACFCTSLGIDPAQAPNADILFTPVASGWSLNVQHKAGEQALTHLEQAGLTEAGEAEPLPFAGCSIQADTADLVASLDGETWLRAARGCIGCGVCAAVCPTCHCFALHQQGNTALRCMDSCMFGDYARLAGETASLSVAERLRHRYVHKLGDFQRDDGRRLCVGCGRCVEHCPAGLDIAALLEGGVRSWLITRCCHNYAV